MSPEEVRLVRESWRGILPIRDTFAALFYAKLFELDPALRPLFKDDLKEQGRNFVAMVSIALRNLERPEAVLHALRELGARHARYGVRDAHYDTVATALVLSLDVSLGESLTPQARRAWEGAYELMTQPMREGALARVA
jgi:hemoglobin-like flavoprotein